MNRTRIRANREAPVLLGALLILGGAAAFALQQSGVRIGDLVGDAGWPLFVIVPGLVLVAASLVVTPPRGIGFAIAGAIVLTVGLILLYQDSTGEWDSWAYAWALIPGAAGLAMAAYGTIASERGLVLVGARLAAIAGVLFAIGLWFFGPIFREGRPPVDLDQWWPAVLVGAGVVIVLSAILGSRGDGGRHVDQGHAA